MAKHLLRDVAVEVDRASVVALERLQPEIEPRQSTASDPVRAAFEPIIEVAAGTVLAEALKDDPTRYRFYQVVEDVLRAYNDLERDKSAIVRRFDVRHGPYGDQISRRHRGGRPVRSLAGLAQLQYRAVPDRFLSVLRIPIITEWQVEDIPATAAFPTKRMAGLASLAIRDGRAEATVKAPEHPLFVDEPSGIDVAVVYRKLEHGAIAPSTPSTPLWSATDARYVGGSFGGSDAVFRFMVPRVSLAFGDGDIAATRETFRGLTLKGFGHRIMPEYPTGFDLMTARDAYIVNIYGRDARIVQSGANHVSLIHEGEPLQDSQVDDVQTLIQYLCGNRGQHITTETFDATGRLTYEFNERSGPTERGQPPIQLDHWTTTTNLVAPQFEAMLSAIRRLRDKAPVKLDAAFHHYFEGVNSSYPVTRILMLAVAIDTLVALQIGNQRQASIIDNRIFQRAIKPIRAAVERSLAAESVPSDKATKILNKLQSLNNASAAQRQRDFWTDLGINLTTEEAEVLESRHEVVHEGHVGSERTSDALWDNYRRSGVLANLFNRAMLALLGWNGPYLDATVTDRHVELPLHAPRSGESAEAAIPSADVSEPAQSSSDSRSLPDLWR
ncbi:MAG TPA: hypothetical protein VMD91_16155 [Candidatus Sulfotelmatobacter sp.]|nr:hypothetical protein [Candidatus Sulfotelmatobacter sp.]